MRKNGRNMWEKWGKIENGFPGKDEEKQRKYEGKRKEFLE
jgi:hypothetical protein